MSVLYNGTVLLETFSRCERCGDNHAPRALDYCAKCSKNLCVICMKRGCCGKTPALSGEQFDAMILQEDDGGY